MSRRPSIVLACVLAPTFLLGGTAAGAGDLAGVVYERVLMREAGARCKLFEPRLQAALAAGALQARGAALRAGMADGAVDGATARARARADATACASPDLHIAAQRVRAAFMGWSRQATLALPGGRGGWSARRWPDRRGPFWALATSGVLDGRRFTLGLRKAGRSDGPAEFELETSAPGAGRAWLVRLVTRDPARAPRPYLAPGGSPPAQAERMVAASGRTALDGGGAWRFRFPAAAGDALAALDPRENARLDLVFSSPGGDRTASALIEAGDFAVGRAFLSAGPSR